MAISIAFVPKTGKQGATGIKLEDIPDEIKSDMEEMYEAGVKNPTGRFRIGAENAEELGKWISYATAYAAQRDGGPIYFRKCPVKGLPDNAAEFKCGNFPSKDAASTAINEAAEAVKAAPAVEATLPANAVPMKRATAKK